ncbi:hypothetical protein C8J57DRAFT_1465776 [Mycena rebaudengoi]|nr:hypothetical protein C8J57DRAFT_1465776 [Mycena rebaudengoi]
MKFSTAFFALIPLVAAVSSSKNVVAPAPDVGNVTLCDEPNFGGTCIVVHPGIGQCTSIPGFTAKSFGPDAGLTCFVFNQGSCSGVEVGPITNGHPIPVGFEIVSFKYVIFYWTLCFKRTLIWFEDAPNQFYVKCENGAQCPAPEVSHLCKARLNLKLQRFWEPAINSKLNLERQDIRLLIRAEISSGLKDFGASTDPPRVRGFPRHLKQINLLKLNCRADGMNMDNRKNARGHVYELEGRDGVVEADVPAVENARVADGASLESGAAAITGANEANSDVRQATARTIVKCWQLASRLLSPFAV